MRLDRDTSGVIVFAYTAEARSNLGKAMVNKDFHKVYSCLVKGKTAPKGTITHSLLKTTEDRRMLVNQENGKACVTHFKQLKYFKNEDVSLLEVVLETGRMHQIRAHFKHEKHPLIGDIMYGEKMLNDYFADTYNFKRLFLHAKSLTLKNTKFDFSFEAELPEELSQLIKDLS